MCTSLEHQKKGLIKESYCVGEFWVVLREKTEVLFVVDAVQQTEKQECNCCSIIQFRAIFSQIFFNHAFYLFMQVLRSLKPSIFSFTSD